MAFIVLLISFSGTPVRQDSPGKYMVIWNVGQGQWATAVTPDRCLHFDLGGEFFPLKKISQTCGRKKNQAFLSHADWDHLSALKKLKSGRILPKFCIAQMPKVIASKQKNILLNFFPNCAHKLVSPEVQIYQSHSTKSANDASNVFGYDKFLLPGDSTRSQEILWKDLAWASKSKVLVLGHHGSNTSTSPELLAQLQDLKWAISSARWARYHHPSSQVVSLLRKSRVPMLKTEDWGNIWYRLE